MNKKEKDKLEWLISNCKGYEKSALKEILKIIENLDARISVFEKEEK